jgi:hypothetical protein
MIEDTGSPTSLIVSQNDFFNFEENFKELIEFWQLMFSIPCQRIPSEIIVLETYSCFILGHAHKMCSAQASILRNLTRR